MRYGTFCLPGGFFNYRKSDSSLAAELAPRGLYAAEIKAWQETAAEQEAPIKF